jgi:hypothetical protein
VVDDDLVAAVGTKRCLDGLGDRLAGFNVADNGAIFRVMAIVENIVSSRSLFKYLSLPIPAY